MMFDKVADVLISSAQAALKPEKPFNPCPAGSIVAGSSTDMILRFMRCSPPGRWYFFGEVSLALGRSKGEVDWGLRRLRELGLLEAEAYQAPRRPPVLRYRMKQDCAEKRFF